MKSWVVRASSTITMIKQTKGKSNFIKNKEKHWAECMTDSGDGWALPKKEKLQLAVTLQFLQLVHSLLTKTSDTVTPQMSWGSGLKGVN